MSFPTGWNRKCLPLHLDSGSGKLWLHITAGYHNRDSDVTESAAWSWFSHHIQINYHHVSTSVQVRYGYSGHIGVMLLLEGVLPRWQVVQKENR